MVPKISILLVTHKLPQITEEGGRKAVGIQEL